LLATTLKVYEFYLTVDIDGVGEELLSLPIKADCQVTIPDYFLCFPSL
ncbi:unnamed protein product, partial [Choristocarpus tenellus]